MQNNLESQIKCILDDAHWCGCDEGDVDGIYEEERDSVIEQLVELFKRFKKT